MNVTHNFLKALGLIACLLMSASAVNAHSKMTSTPVDGAVVDVGLSQLGINFSKAMRLTMVHIRTLPDKIEINPTSKLPVSFVTSTQITVPPLQPGQYSLMWTAVGKDGHVMRGSFSFSVIDQ